MTDRLTVRHIVGGLQPEQGRKQRSCSMTINGVCYQQAQYTRTLGRLRCSKQVHQRQLSRRALRIRRQRCTSRGPLGRKIPLMSHRAPSKAAAPAQYNTPLCEVALRCFCIKSQLPVKACTKLACHNLLRQRLTGSSTARGLDGKKHNQQRTTDGAGVSREQRMHRDCEESSSVSAQVSWP